MLIAIAADLHDNLSNLEKFNNYTSKQGISSLLFCGDLGNEETLSILASSFIGKIYLVAGNADMYSTDKKSWPENISFLGTEGLVDLGGKKIGLIHEPYREASLRRQQGKMDYIFYGHSHKPWLATKDNTMVANPGTLGGLYYQASFAVLDTDNNQLTLKILEKL